MCVIIWSLSWASLAVSNAQHYRSELLKSIAGMLPQDMLPVDGQQVVLHQRNFLLHVVSENDTVTHLGIKLFHHIPVEYQKVSFFLERVMLEFLLAQGNQDIKRVMDKNNCMPCYNRVEYDKRPIWDLVGGIALAYNSTHYSIKRDSLMYIAEWTSTPNTFSVRFPANAQIILGMDKKELDEAFIEGLLSIRTTGYRAMPSLPQHTLNLEKIGNVYRTKGRQLFIPEMNDCRYYLQSDDGNYRTIYSPQYPAESLVNLFYQASDTNSVIRLIIQHLQYGNVLKEYNVPLSWLYEYAQIKGFEIYVGIESHKKEQLAATVLLYNMELNFLNVLYVQTSADQLFRPSGGSITAKLRTNIPTDNIKDLFQRHYPKNHYK